MRFNRIPEEVERKSRRRIGERRIKELVIKFGDLRVLHGSTFVRRPGVKL